MAERYDVVLDGQLGERRGTLTWTETDGRLTGTFTLFGSDNPVIGCCSGAVHPHPAHRGQPAALLHARGAAGQGAVRHHHLRPQPHPLPREKTDGKDRRMIYQQKVDFQAHYLPKVYYDFLEEGLYCPDGFPAPEWDEAWQQEAMTELGISYALLSISSPSVFTGNKFRSRELARKINEEGAQIVSRAPGNLDFLATLPLPLVHSSIFEARYCLDELHTDGVGLMTNYGGVYLGDRRLDELMAELVGRGALAVMHPTQPAVMVPDVNEEIPVPAFEYFVETTRAFLNMAQNDTFTLYPNIRWVVPHVGAFLSILTDRFESFALMLRFADPDRRADIMEDMAHAYYDAAGFSEQKQLEMLLRNVDESHLFYGSDTPYTDITACVGQAEALEQTAKLTDAQKQKLFTGNALALLPKLKERIHA